MSKLPNDTPEQQCIALSEANLKLRAELEAAKAKLKESQDWANELAADLCKIEDAMGFKQDQTNPDGSWKPTMDCVMEKIRDWIKAAADLEDAKADNARMAAALQKLADGMPRGLHLTESFAMREYAKEQLKDSTALRELLGPTVELLKDGVLSWEGEGPAISRARFKEELARLRAVMGGKG